jgi:hypothetical protein
MTIYSNIIKKLMRVWNWIIWTMIEGCMVYTNKWCWVYEISTLKIVWIAIIENILGWNYCITLDRRLLKMASTYIIALRTTINRSRLLVLMMENYTFVLLIIHVWNIELQTISPMYVFNYFPLWIYTIFCKAYSFLARRVPLFLCNQKLFKCLHYIF